MNKNDAAQYLPLVQALANGKEIQISGCAGWDYWEDIAEVSFNRPASEYRIKPEPREIWFNRYPSGVENGPYSCKEAAIEFANHDTVPVQVCYREVLE